MMGRGAIGCLAAMLLMAFSTVAEAKRTIVDEFPDGTINPVVLENYCDFNGEDCGATPLGYTIDFGDGVARNSIVFYGNGMLSFGNTAAVFALDPPGDPSGNVIFVPVEYLTPGLRNDLIQDFGFQPSGRDDLVFEQSGKLKIDYFGKITGNWEVCFGTDDCVPTYAMTITPQADGLNVLFDFKGNDPIDFSPVVNIFDNFYQGSSSFFIPATITGLVSSVPEPSTWAMMMIGLGVTGFALRRRRELVAQGEGAAAPAFCPARV